MKSRASSSLAPGTTLIFNKLGGLCHVISTGLFLVVLRVGITLGAHLRKQLGTNRLLKRGDLRFEILRIFLMKVAKVADLAFGALDLPREILAK